MRTRWSKFSGIAGAILFVVGLGALTVFGTATIPVVAFGHLFLGILLILIWFVFEGARALARPGEFLSQRAVRFGSGAFAYTVLFVALLVGINFLGRKYNKRFDLTRNGVFSLAPQTEELLGKLSGTLKLVAFEEGAGQLGPAAELLKLYGEANRSKVSTEVIDPRSKPHLIEKYGMKQGNMVYLEYQEGESKGVSRVNTASEESLTNAILKLTRGAAKKVYFVTGHGEPSIQDEQDLGLRTLSEALQDEHMQVDNLLLSTVEKLPEDAAAVFLIAPQKVVQPSELALLQEYVNNGGSLFVMTDPQFAPEVRDFVSGFGIELNNDVVVDTVQRLFAGPAIGVEPIANSYGIHPITRGFTSGQDISIFRIASSVGLSEDSKVEGASYVKLVMTGPSSWAETNLSAIFDSEEPSVAFEDGDTSGPVALAIAYEKPVSSENPGADSERGRLVVFGDSDWVRNAFIGSFFNRDLALNATSWLSGEEGGLSIRPRTMSASATAMTPQEVKSILAASFVVPELILIAGLLVWWRRREVHSGVQLA